jgi:hypothetical protein
MDDTQWVTDEKSKLENMLYIADTFYRLNDIQINKDKSELIMRAKKKGQKYSHIYNEKILIKFGNEEIHIKAKHPHEPLRILGVHFNIEHDEKYLLSKIKTEIDHLTNLMFKKKITDKHILYIFNRLIVPRVEYWSQVLVLTKKQTEQLIIPFRRMFKNKLKFAKTAPNAILDNPHIYGYRDFYENQLQAKITDFCIQLNDQGLLGTITSIRLKSLQEQLWCSKPIVEKIPFDRIPNIRRNNYLLNMVLLCKHNNILLEILDKTTFSSIQGGKIPIEDVVDYTFYSKHRNRLRNNRILFLDQLVSGDKSRLLMWKDICNKVYISMINNGKKEEKWYKDIKKIVTLDGVNLKQEVKSLFTCRFDNIEDTRSYDISKKDKSLVAIYNFQYNSILLGKVHKIDGDNVIIKHYNVDTTRNIDGKIFLSQCDNNFCSINNPTQQSSICTFSTDWRYIVPILTASKFTKESVKKNRFVNYNIYNLFDVAKRKYELLHNTLMSSHVTTSNQSENIILDLLEPSYSRNNLLII